MPAIKSRRQGPGPLIFAGNLDGTIIPVLPMVKARQPGSHPATRRTTTSVGMIQNIIAEGPFDVLGVANSSAVLAIQNSSAVLAVQ